MGASLARSDAKQTPNYLKNMNIKSGRNESVAVSVCVEHLIFQNFDLCLYVLGGGV